MQLTRAADYGVRVIVHLASPTARGRRESLGEIARAAEAPQSFLSKVLQALARAGLIESRRGQAGGFQISSRGSAANMREVIEAIDGPIRLNLCLADDNNCHRKFWCPSHPVWARAQEAMLAVLESATVADLVEQGSTTFRPSSSAGLVCLGLNAPLAS